MPPNQHGKSTLTLYVTGNSSVEPVLALASVVLGIGFACFAINLWQHTAQ